MKLNLHEIKVNISLLFPALLAEDFSLFYHVEATLQCQKHALLLASFKIGPFSWSRFHTNIGQGSFRMGREDRKFGTSRDILSAHVYEFQEGLKFAYTSFRLWFLNVS